MKFNGLDGFGKIKIYTGPIHEIYVENFSLVRGKPIGNKKERIVNRTANFYIGNGAGGEYENIEYGCVLPNREEAIKKCEATIDKNKLRILSVLNAQNSNPKEQHRILNEIKNEIQCAYYVKSELQYERTIQKKELKELIKLRETIINKNKK